MRPHIAVAAIGILSTVCFSDVANAIQTTGGSFLPIEDGSTHACINISTNVVSVYLISTDTTDSVLVVPDISANHRARGKI
jgi:uncharacterized RmlC-like cupin family protein